MKPIFIVDLNAGLIEGFKPSKKVTAYEYRSWLIEEHLKECFTVLVTNRSEDFAAETIRHIYEKTGWIPNDWYFLPHTQNQRQWKRVILLDHIYPKHGSPNKREVVALDAPTVSGVYARYGVTPLWIEGEALMQEE